MDSEFKQLIDTLRRLGVNFSIDYNPTKEKWQNPINRAGYNITALACVVVVVGDTEFLFSTGQPHWENDTGSGPDGLFMLSRNTKTKRIENRVFYHPDDNVNISLKRPRGLVAAMASYPDSF